MLTTPAHMEIRRLEYRQTAHKLTGNYRDMQKDTHSHVDKWRNHRQMHTHTKLHSEIRHTPNIYIVDIKTQNTSQIHRHTCYLHTQAQRVVYKHTHTGHQQRPIETQTKTGRHT